MAGSRNGGAGTGAGGYDSQASIKPAGHRWRSRGDALAPIAQVSPTQEKSSSAWGVGTGQPQSQSPSQSPKVPPGMPPHAAGGGGTGGRRVAALAPSSPVAARNAFRSEWMKLARNYQDLNTLCGGPGKGGGAGSSFHAAAPNTARGGTSSAFNSFRGAAGASGGSAGSSAPRASSMRKPPSAFASEGSFRHIPVYNAEAKVLVPPIGGGAALPVAPPIGGIRQAFGRRACSPTSTFGRAVSATTASPASPALPSTSSGTPFRAPLKTREGSPDRGTPPEKALTGLGTRTESQRSTAASESAGGSTPGVGPRTHSTSGASGGSGTNRLFDQIYGALNTPAEQEAFARKLFHLAVLGARSMPELRCDAAHQGLLNRRFASMQNMLGRGPGPKPVNRDRLLIAQDKTPGSFRVATCEEVRDVRSNVSLALPVDAELDSDGDSDDVASYHSSRASTAGRGRTAFGRDSPSIPHTTSVTLKHNTSSGSGGRSMKGRGKAGTSSVTFVGEALEDRGVAKDDSLTLGGGGTDAESVSGSERGMSPTTRQEKYAQLRNPEVLAKEQMQRQQQQLELQVEETGEDEQDMFPVFDPDGDSAIFDTVPDMHYLEQFESFTTIVDHSIVETSELCKGEDMEGNKKINEYAVICELGRGSYAKVKLVCHDATDEPFALKIMNKSLLKKMKKHGGSTALEQVRVELAIMKKIAHPRIVRLHEVIDDTNADKLYLILDYIDGGVICDIDKDGRTDPLDARLVARYLRQICSALGYLHRHNIVHRDIKPSNILVDKNECAYLCDFGVSTILSGSNADIAGIEGTPFFFAPEMCEGGEFDGKIADLWALGASVYVCLLGCVPFFATDPASIMDKIQNDAVTIPFDTDPDVKSLLRGMLNKSAKKRMTLDEIRVHPFIAMQGSRHPSLQYGEPIVISVDDVENAFSLGNGIEERAAPLKTSTSFKMRVYKKGVASIAARRYAHRYCETVRLRVKERKARVSREIKERQRAGSLTPTTRRRASNDRGDSENSAASSAAGAGDSPEPFGNVQPFSPEARREIRQFREQQRRLSGSGGHESEAAAVAAASFASPDFVLSPQTLNADITTPTLQVLSPLRRSRCWSGKGSTASLELANVAATASARSVSQDSTADHPASPGGQVFHVAPLRPGSTPTSPHLTVDSRSRGSVNLVLDRSGNLQPMTPEDDDGDGEGNASTWDDALFSTSVPVGSPAKAARSRNTNSPCAGDPLLPAAIVISPPTEAVPARTPMTPPGAALAGRMSPRPLSQLSSADSLGIPEPRPPSQAF